ncbi:nuclear transport factor 2 family protein [Austwickia chelonae]|uniref:nuclear transport factor 2 family protein n=1 Tax=Austwickia chelonae TaxID=100225 RepID=UPI001F083ED0|nr:nuclear transport factor 2 family protein [Austwickia chelonae]
MILGRRPQVLINLTVIGVNLLVLPNWFSPGRFPLQARLAFVAVHVVLIALCSWWLSQALGVNPFTRRRHPVYTPYALDPEAGDLPTDRSGKESSGKRNSRDNWGRSGDFREFDPHEEEPDPPTAHDRELAHPGADGAVACTSMSEGHTSDQRRRTVQRYYDALDRDDLEAVLECFSGDVLYRRPGYPVMTGSEQLRAYYSEERRLARGRHSVRNLLVDGQQVAAQGTYEGELREGDRMTVDFAAFFVIDGNDRICEHATYFYVAHV